MRLPNFDYFRPQSVSDACRLLEVGGTEAQAIAGGTELILSLKNRQKRARALVDLAAIPDVNCIQYSPQTGLRIGALATLRHIAQHADVKRHYPMLACAAASAGGPQLQAMGTIGGNLCQDNCCQYFNRSATERRAWDPCVKLGGDVCYVVDGSKQCWAAYCGDVAPALLALNATVTVADADGQHRAPLEEIFSSDGARPHTLRAGQIVTEIHAPPPQANSGGVYAKLRQRGALDYPLLGVAAQVTMEADGITCREAAVALTGVNRSPSKVADAVRLEGQKLTAERIAEVAEAARTASQPMKTAGDLPASYRREMVNVYVESALQDAMSAAVRES